MIRSRTLILILLMLATTACGDETIVATAAGSTLSVDDLATLLEAGEVIGPGSRSATLEMANLWVDYTLLATAMSEDPTLTHLDMEPVVDQLVEQQMVAEFRTTRLQLDTVLTGAELQAAYDRDGQESEVRIHHLVRTWPAGASPAQREAVRALVRALRERIVEGESFGDIAQEFSQDEYAPLGGDTGYFPRGQMIDLVDQAAFALPTGELSQPIESAAGVHLIRVEGRRTPSLSVFRERLQAQRLAAALGQYVVTLEAMASPEASADAFDIIREIAADPRTTLEGIPDDRSIVEYRDGTLTVAEARRFLHARTGRIRAQLAAAGEDDLRGRVLRPMLQGKLLRAAAESEGVSVPATRRESLAAEAREELADAAQQLGLVDFDSAGVGSDPTEAVIGLLRTIAVGDREVLPLGIHSYVLSQAYSGGVNADGLEATARRIGAMRDAR